MSALARRIKRLEARCATVNPITREPHTFVFVDPDRTVKSAMLWDKDNKMWVHLQEPAKSD